MTKSSIENDTNQVVTYIRDGDKIGVSVFLRRGGDPNTRNNMGWTLLHLACLEGQAEIAEILLDAGAMVNCCTTDMCTPLHLASARGNKRAVEVLVAKGAYINAQDKAGNTPLHEAAKAFHTPIVKYLIENKADRNRMNKKNQIFIDLVGQQMMPTVEAGDVEVLLQWLDWGLVANTVGNLHWSLLHHSSARGQINIASLLLERGANVNILDSNRSTPLHSACFHGHKRIAELLLGRGADINAKDQRGNTPLHSAVSGEHPEVINLLLESGCDTSIPNKEGQIFTHLVNEFLIEAVEKSRVAQVVSLLKGAADPNTKDSSGYPVLCSSTLKGDLLIVDALLEAGANPNLCSEATQKTPLHYACSVNNLFILKALLDRGASVASKDKYGFIPLHEAAKEGDKNLITVLMGRGSSLNAQDMDGNTPLHIAARWGQSEVVEQLLENGAAEDIRNKNGMLYSDLALMRAVRTEDATQVMSGLAWGGNPNIQDSKGWTLLHHAVYKSARDVCFILLESEPDVNIADKNGRTPLLLAAYRGNQEIVEMLLNAGADINAKDLENRTPLHWAADEGSIETVELLISRGANQNIKNKKGLLYSDLLLKHLYFAVRHNDEEKVESFLRAGADQTAELYGTEVTPIEEAKRRKYYSILKKMVAMKPAKPPPPKSSKEEFIALEDVKRLFEDYEKDDSSDESEDEDFDPDEDAYWKMHNAPVVLSAKELLEEEEKSFWDHWEEKPKVISAKEFFKEKASWWEAASSSSEEVSSSSSDEKESDDEVPTFEELKKSWGKVVPAKDFFREDECWWRDAVEDLDKPKIISAKEFFKEKTAWWEQSSSDEEAKEIQERNSKSEEIKIIPSKDLFQEDVPWWQTENSSEEESENEKKYLSPDNKANNKSEEKSEEESSVYEDIEESFTEDWETANDSVMSDSSTTMYSISDGEKISASDLFVENPWWYNEDDQTDNSISEDKLSEDRSDRTETTEVAEEESFIDIDKYDGRTRILSPTDSDASTNIMIDTLDSNSIENLLELDIEEDHYDHISPPQNDDKMFECSNKAKNHRNTTDEVSVDLSQPINIGNEKCLTLQDLSNNPIEEPILRKSIISEKEEMDTPPKFLNHNVNNSRLELEKLEEPHNINASSRISSSEFSNDINENSMNNRSEYQKHHFDFSKTENPENASNENEDKDLAPITISLSEEDDENSFESKRNLCGSLKQYLVNDKVVLPTVVQGNKRLVKKTENDDKENYSNLNNTNMITTNNLEKIDDVSKNANEVKTSSSCNFVIIPNIQNETDMFKEDESSHVNLNDSDKLYNTSNSNLEKANEFLDSLKKTDILELESNPSHSQFEQRTIDTQSSLTHINSNSSNSSQNVNDSNKSEYEKPINTNPPVTNKMNACLARVDATLAWLDARMANDSLNATLSHKSSSLPCIPKPTFSKTPKNMIHESLERVHENDSAHPTNTKKCKENFSIFRLKIRINDQHAPQTFEHYTDKPEDDSSTFTRGFNSSKCALHNSEGSLHKLKINENSYTNSNKCNIKKCNSIAKLETTTRLQDYDSQKPNMRTSDGNFSKFFKDFSRQSFLSDIFNSKYSQVPDVLIAERRHSVGSIISEGNKEQLSKNSSNLHTSIKNKNSKNHRRHSFDESVLKVKGILNSISPFISNLKMSEKVNKVINISTSDKKSDYEIIPDVQSVKGSNVMNSPCHRKENATSDKSNVSFDTCKMTQNKKKSSNNICNLISSSQPDQNKSSLENTSTSTPESSSDNFISTSIIKPATLYSTTTTTATTTTTTTITKTAATTSTRTTTTTTTTISTTTTAATTINTTTSTTPNHSNNFNNTNSNSRSKDKSCYRISSDSSKENLAILEPLNSSGKETDHLESTFHISKMNDEKNILEISVSSDDKIIFDPFQKCRPKPFECVKLPNDFKDGFCLENNVALSSENLNKKQESLEHIFPTNKCVTESNLRIKPPLPPRRNKDNRQMSNKNDSYDITKFPVENTRINDVNRLSCNLGKSESSEQDIQMADSLNGEKLSLPDEELHQTADKTHVEEVVPKYPELK